MIDESKITTGEKAFYNFGVIVGIVIGFVLAAAMFCILTVIVNA